jgi:hypothetical protein
MKRLAPGSSIVLPYLLILAVALLRLAVSQPYNFVPIFSCLLFFGACRPAREFVMPFFVLVGVDIFLTTHQFGFALTAGHAVTWLWYLGALFLGAIVLGRSNSTGRVLGSSLLVSVSFFVASNFTVWAEWGMYPKTWAGLGACYVAALPFFRNSIVSETICSVALFAIVRHCAALATARRMEGACS